MSLVDQGVDEVRVSRERVRQCRIHHLKMVKCSVVQSGIQSYSCTAVQLHSYTVVQLYSYTVIQ